MRWSRGWYRYPGQSIVGVGMSWQDWGIGFILDDGRFEVAVGPFWFYWAG